MESFKQTAWKIFIFLLKILALVPIFLTSLILLLIFALTNLYIELWFPVQIGAVLILPALFILLFFFRKHKRCFIIWGICSAVFVAALGINIGIVQYEKSLVIDTSPNIDVHEYLPFDEDSKIVKLDKEASLQLTDKLPVIDGAAALFPVYSAYVNAVYPASTELYDGVFEHNNTVFGYEKLAEKETDIFIGVFPSQEQIDYAQRQDTTFTYTQIGMEAFVFFVHKNNPIESLTAEQIRGIYSGQITNWKEVGGRDEAIAAFQRNENSGSQSMLIRFMDGTPIMEPPTELVNGFMSGIVEQVADYKSKTGSIGFSYRFYVEGILQNPDIKMIAIDGVAPTAENVRSGAYPVLTPIYAVTYEGNENENVQKLLDWILSEEGQYILEKTGYVGN